eukprot:Sdes_comp20514_c0_seq3m15058
MEGEYAGIEHEPVAGVVESMKVTSEKNSSRIAKFAFDYAIQHSRRKVTAIHKANILRLGDGLFLQCCYEQSKCYPGIQYDSMVVDTASMRMVMSPQSFDVVVTPNLYGNILQNVAAGIVGGAGMVPGINIGPEHAIFEPGARHVAKDLEGKNVANPIAMLLSAALMLEHLSLDFYADLIRKGIFHTLIHTEIRTQDIGGSSSMSQFTDAIIKNIQIISSESKSVDDSFI